MPAPVQLAAYRIVQEALTNVLRHAGPGTAATVGLRIAGEELVVEVVDDAAGRPPTPAQSGGFGISGMRERAALLGGELAAGHADGGGFRVVGHLQLVAAGQGRVPA